MNANNQLISNVNIDSGDISNVNITANSINLAGDINLGGDIIPTQDAVYSIGSATRQIKDMYLSSSTLYMGTEILGEVKPILTVSGGRAEFIGAVISPDDIATITKLDGLEISGNVTFTNNESKIIIEGDVSLNNSLDVNGNIKLKGIHEGSQLKALYYNTTTGEITYDNSGNTQLLSVIEGTASASKALVVDSNRDIGNIGNITITGQINGPSSLIIDPAGVGDNTGLVVIKGGLQVDGSSTIINSSTLDISDHRILLSNLSLIHI